MYKTELGRTQRLQFASLACAIMLTVGTPNLNAFDITGLTQDFGIINLSSIWRIFIFASIGISLIVLYEKRRRMQSLRGMYFIWAYFSLMALSTLIMSRDNGELFLGIYRVVEWVIVLISIQMLINREERAIQTFSDFLKWTSIYAILVLILVSLYDFNLVYLYSMETGTFRFGGVANHPNNLGLVLGLGSLAWLSQGRTNVKYIVAILLMMLSILCWSRTCTAATIAAFLVYYGSRYTIHHRTNVATIATTALGLFLTVLTALFFSDLILDYAQRGQRAQYLSTAAGREDVWLGALALIEESPMTGHGFIIGPKLLRYSSYIPSHWAAPNAHNDFLNAGISGGIGAMILLTLIYVLVATSCLRQIRHEPLLFSCFVAIFMTSLFSDALSGEAIFRGIALVVLARAASFSNLRFGLVNTNRRRVVYG